MTDAMEFHKQFIRYALIGLVSNGAIYVIYLFITRIGMGAKLAMSLLYCVGVLQTFFFNRKWSFRFGGAATPAFIRYLAAYAGGYFFNLLALILLVDRAGFPHQLIQGVMIFVVAVVLFVAQRYWVFPQLTRRDPT
jgi:putative flippase GtrA